MLHLEDVGVKKKRSLAEDRKIPCVSPGMGEMMCELREWNERKVQCRMTIMGRAQQMVKEKTEEGWTKRHPVPAPLATQRP